MLKPLKYVNYIMTFYKLKLDVRTIADKILSLNLVK